ncbi:MAG: hypothetical protein KA712_16570 [Myxococcales bacterium]|nr:hypothetical protein [Myxococcales bacterium]
MNPCSPARRAPPPRVRAWCAVSVLALGVGGPSVAAAANLNVRGELGGEYDSNPGRVDEVPGNDNPSPTPSPGARGQLGLEGASALGSAGVLAGAVRVAGRAYAEPDAQRERVAVLQGNLSLSQRLSRRNRLQASMGYYDAFQAEGRAARDFRSFAPTLLVARDTSWGRLGLGGGYRHFVYKPSNLLTFGGPTASASYRYGWGPSQANLLAEGERDEDAPDWDVALFAQYEQRRFEGPRCVAGQICPPPGNAPGRVDEFTSMGVALTRTSSFLLGAGASVQINASNSYGDGLVRGLGHLEGTFLLPWDLSLSGRAELVWTRFTDAVSLRRDPISGLPVASIEDESRSTLRVEVLRPLSALVDVSARWIGYTNEFGGGTARYRRQTFLIQLGVSLDAL